MVQAEPKQYGFFNTPTALNCTTTLDVFRFLVVTTWFRGEGSTKAELSERPHFDSTAISNEGVYACQVDITEMSIVIEKKMTSKSLVSLYCLKVSLALSYLDT